MPDFVFEIGTEEIPARFLPRLRTQLEQLTQQLLQQQDLTGEVTSYATPRRLVVFVAQLPAEQPVREEVVTGPPVAIGYDDAGQPTKAAQGFAKSQGMEVEDLFAEQTERGAYLAVRKTVGGHATFGLLPQLCRDLLQGISFPKSMRWEASQATFARPVRWLLALLGTEVVDVQAMSLCAGRQTFGHRTMGPGPWDVPEAATYFTVVRENGRVILDVEKRRRIIREQADAQAAAHGGRVAWDEALLGEVADLVEWPQPVLGAFDSDFLELPRAVLVTSMQSHQKSFGVEDQDGALLPYFVCTLDVVPQDLELVRKGWERVLRARLEDARF
ncbi:MAG: glycine--tRNA ligase subunit beta, partial [Desulfohalobium sp.]